MNEITKIHLGRQAFTIAVDAHKLLRDYLHDIKRQVGDKGADVLEEVELRVAELLAERGISGDKVVLVKDIQYVKKQLGEPGDFGEEEGEAPRQEGSGAKRLFRDTDNAMLAGVAAGLGKYFGLDPIWFRLAFIALIFAGGSGVLIYIILWVLVPEAKTSSDRLQMQGKQVTVDALKEVVERADVEVASRRASNAVGKAVDPVLKVLLAIVGVPLIIAGALALMALLTIATYLIVHGTEVNNQVVFPVGTQETLVVVLAAVFGAIASVVIMFCGIAMVNRRRSLPGWVAGILLVLFIGAGSVGTALAFDTVPQVSNRIENAEMRMEGDVCKENVFNHCSYWRLQLESGGSANDN